MAIASSDIKFFLTTKSGAAGDTTSSTPAASLGKYKSTTEITDASLNNLFDDISGDENAASDVEYRAIYVLNNHGSLTLQGAVVWLSAEVEGGAAVAIALDNVAVNAKGSASAQGDDIADESTAPDAVGAFSSPTSKGTGLSIGDIAAGSGKMIWIRRTAANSAAKDSDGATIRVEGDTAA